MWTPETLAFLVPPNIPVHVEVDRDQCMIANRVDHCVPIFRFPVGPMYGTPAPASSSGNDHPAPRAEDRKPEAGEDVPVLRPDDPDRAQGPEDDEGEVWVDELDPKHWIAHLPKSNKCNICKQAKLLAKPHRRLANQSANLKDVHEAIAPKAFMERIAIDHMFAKQHLGVEGEEVVLVCVDLFSGLCAACPAVDRSTESVEEALRFFAGRLTGQS